MSQPVVKKNNSVSPLPAQQFDMRVELIVMLVSAVIIAVGLALRQKYSLNTQTQVIIFTSGGVLGGLAVLSVMRKCLSVPPPPPLPEYEQTLLDLKKSFHPPPYDQFFTPLHEAIERLRRHCETSEQVRAIKEFILERVEQGDNLLALNKIPENLAPTVALMGGGPESALEPLLRIPFDDNSLGATKMRAVFEILKAAYLKSKDPHLFPLRLVVSFDPNTHSEELFSEIVKEILNFGNYDTVALKRFQYLCVLYKKTVYTKLIIEKLSQSQCQALCDHLCEKFVDYKLEVATWCTEMIIHLIQSKRCHLGSKEQGFLHVISLKSAAQDWEGEERALAIKILQAAGLDPSDYKLTSV